MKKLAGFALISAVLLFMESGQTFAQQMSPMGMMPTIAVNGAASQSYSPDTAIVVLSIETTEKNAQEAANLNAKKADKVISKLKSQINCSKGDLVKTTSYSLQPVWTWDEGKKQNVQTGYQARNEVTLTTKQVKNVGNLIDTAISNGANQVQSVSFTLEDRSDLCNKALTDAATSAKVQAETVAKALGVNIIGVKSAYASCGVPVQPRPYMMKTMGMARDEAVSTPIEAGDVKVNANVNAEFYTNGFPMPERRMNEGLPCPCEKMMPHPCPCEGMKNSPEHNPDGSIKPQNQSK